MVVFLLQDVYLRLKIGNLSADSRLRFLALGRERVQAICKFLLNGKDLAIEVLNERLERSTFLLAVRFKSVSQVLDDFFKGINLEFWIGYLAWYLHLCIRGYVGRLKGRVGGKEGRFLLSEVV